MFKLPSPAIGKVQEGSASSEMPPNAGKEIGNAGEQTSGGDGGSSPCMKTMYEYESPTSSETDPNILKVREFY